jgi:hypothetical protein
MAFRESSWCLIGPPAGEVFPPVGRPELEDALRTYLADLHARPRDEPIGWLASTLLNAARCLFGLAHGRHAGKREAAMWLAEREPDLRAPLAEALAVRRSEPCAKAERIREGLDRLRDLLPP